MTNSKTVRILDVAGNHIGDEGVKIIVTALTNKQKQQLQTLILADNKVTSVGAQMVAQLMEQCNTLQELQLQNNEIDNKGGEALVKQIKRRKIAKLDCDNNHLTGQILSDLL